jgi:tetratricopeptide (TPR) repeat protein
MRTKVIAAISVLILTMPQAKAESASSMLAYADSVFNASEYIKAESEYRTCLETARTTGERSVETEALAQIARCRLIAHDKSDAARWLAKAGEIAGPDDPLGWTRYLGVKGRMEWQSDSLRRAVSTFEEMFGYARDHGLNGRAIDAVHMVAIVGNPDEQIQWGQKGISLAEETGEDRWLGPLWNNLAITYSEVPDWDKCVDAFTKAREYHWKYGEEINKLYADYHVGWAFRMRGDNDKALKWLRPSLAWAERLENNNVIGQACEDIGEIEIAQGDKDDGLRLLKRALSCFEKEGYPDFSPEIYQHLKERIAELSR